MSKYQYEQKLDELLSFFVSKGTLQAVHAPDIPIFDDKLGQMIEILISSGFIEPVSVNFDDKQPVTFHQLLQLTSAGVWFHHSSSFVDDAKQKKREQKRWKTEYWKLGYDSLVAFLALILSITALTVSLMK